jgi:hypothetical protein
MAVSDTVTKPKSACGLDGKSSKKSRRDTTNGKMMSPAVRQVYISVDGMKIAEGLKNALQVLLLMYYCILYGNNIDD